MDTLNLIVRRKVNMYMYTKNPTRGKFYNDVIGIRYVNYQVRKFRG